MIVEKDTFGDSIRRSEYQMKCMDYDATIYIADYFRYGRLLNPEPSSLSAHLTLSI
jgi:hypothetical protein